jgi:hypothetical protein
MSFGYRSIAFGEEVVAENRSAQFQLTVTRAPAGDRDADDDGRITAERLPDAKKMTANTMIAAMTM